MTGFLSQLGVGITSRIMGWKTTAISCFVGGYKIPTLFTGELSEF